MSTRTNAAPAAPAAPVMARLRNNSGTRRTRLVTIKQFEESHPALAGRMRQWVHRADAGDPAFAGLRRAIIRIGRSVFIDEFAGDGS